MNPSFGARRVRGKKRRGAGDKTIIFGILECHGKVYTEIVQNAAKKPLQAAIRGRLIDSIVHSDGWRGYDGLVDKGHKKHFRVNHGQHEFAHGNCPINGIESFCHMPKEGLQNSMVFREKLLIYTCEARNTCGLRSEGSSGMDHEVSLSKVLTRDVGKRVRTLFQQTYAANDIEIIQTE